jgi:hypothetical protein
MTSLILFNLPFNITIDNELECVSNKMQEI